MVVLYVLCVRRACLSTLEIFPTRMSVPGIRRGLPSYQRAFHSPPPPQSLRLARVIIVDTGLIENSERHAKYLMIYNLIFSSGDSEEERVK